MSKPPPRASPPAPTALAAMGADAAQAKAQLVAIARQMGVAGARMFELAAQAVTDQPQPDEESADETELRRPIDEASVSRAASTCSPPRWSHANGSSGRPGPFERP